MTTTVERVASCWCGDLAVTMQGDPMLVSSCCCTRCQRRTGGFFGVTVYYRPGHMVAQAGAVQTFHHPEGSTTFHFCPRCGSNIWWVPDEEDDVIGRRRLRRPDAAVAPADGVHRDAPSLRVCA